ncbi:DUF2537 domain-containing protein [Tomitella gaofuii]|uniref:DUF2537 domain-containing protein n=1 Tax=Tomitella gaofuii TaxID=2760083 RepID=UPI0015F8A6A4|nr:DUF2537 domain-containing protein [Tomitella gaofuii]
MPGELVHERLRGASVHRGSADWWVGTEAAARYPAAGIVASTMMAAWTAVFVAVVGLGLSAVSSWLAIAVNVVVAGAAAPAVRRWRHATTVRWIVWGVVPGAILGWAALAVLAP